MTRALRLVTAVLLLSLTACRHTRESAQEPDEDELLELYTTTALYLYEDGSWLRAQDQAVKALEIDPGNQSMRRMIGWVRLRLGSNEDLLIAEQFFRKLRAERDPNEATTLGLATAVERLGTAHDETARAFDSGERVPHDGSDPHQRARELAEKAREMWNESSALYREVLEGSQENTAAMNGLQRTAALLGEYERSLEWSERLLAQSSAERETWRRLLTQSDLTDKEEALYRENERASSELAAETRLFAVAVLSRLGRIEEAIAHLDQVAAERPELPQVYSLRAQLRAKSGAYAAAIEDLDLFLRLSDAPFEHPDVRRAFDLRSECEAKLAGHREERGS